MEEGFYYDCYYGSKTLGDADKASIEKKVVQVIFNQSQCLSPLNDLVIEMMQVAVERGPSLSCMCWICGIAGMLLSEQHASFMLP